MSVRGTRAKATGRTSLYDDVRGTATLETVAVIGAIVVPLLILLYRWFDGTLRPALEGPHGLHLISNQRSVF